MYRASLLLLAIAFPGFAQDIEPEDLKPGLLSLHVDSAGKQVQRLEALVGLRWQATEASHPRLKPDGSVTWTGYLNVQRRGSYAFGATLQGTLSVKIAGKEVLSATSNEPKRFEKLGVDLPPGVTPIVVTFSRTGAARLELLWKPPQSPWEPMPYEVFGHLPKDAAGLAPDVLRDHGRLVFEENACARCHTGTDAMTKGLVDRHGPDISAIASRVNAGWLDAWLADPQALRPATMMPKVFADDDAGKTQRHAVTSYLLSLSRPMEPDLKPANGQGVNRGKQLFNTIGCAVCHQTPPTVKENTSIIGLLASHGAQQYYPLGDVTGKTKAEKLATFLAQPAALNPTTRMPSMNLATAEANDLAAFLTSVPSSKPIPAFASRKEEPSVEVITAAFQGVPDELKQFQSRKTTDDRWKSLGKRLVTSLGCVNCHVIAPGGKPLPNLTTKSLADIRKAPAAGCVSATKPGKTPAFSLRANDAKALMAFLTDGLDGAGSPAPSFAAKMTIKRMACLNCHAREGEGGISVDQITAMQKLEKAENADDVRPPLLTGVGHKLRTPWLAQVLTQAGRARPWMTLRMPQYGEANVGMLADGLAALEGAATDATTHAVKLDPVKVDAGRLMVGKTGLGCIGCHDIAGIANTGTRGPDLATTTQRVRYDWYVRWMEVPQKMAPGTRMPQVFVDGKSTLATVLSGDAPAQAEAMWAYLSLGPTLPLPIGLEVSGKGLSVTVKKEPEIFRTFLPGTGSRTIAVGYPEGVNVAFDAAACRLGLAWGGNFLDVGPVWANRGGQQAKLLGPTFWNAPAGNPWGVTSESAPPDFAARATDAAYGATLPLLASDPPKKFVRFEGYALSPAGNPTFRYTVGGPDGEVAVSETPVPAPSPLGGGIERAFHISQPPQRNVWFHVAEGKKPPKRYNAAGEERPFDASANPLELPISADDRYLFGEGTRFDLLSFVGLPPEARVRIVPKADGGSQLVLLLPAGKTAVERTFRVRVRSLPQAGTEFLKSLEKP